MTTAAFSTTPPIRVRTPIPLFLVRWTARLTSLLSLGTLALFVFGEPGVPTGREWALVACFPIGVAAGMMLGWFRELAGGLLTVASLIGLYAQMFASTGSIPNGHYFLILAAPGIIFLLAGLLARSAARRRAGSSSTPATR